MPEIPKLRMTSCACNCRGQQ